MDNLFVVRKSGPIVQNDDGICFLGYKFMYASDALESAMKDANKEIDTLNFGICGCASGAFSCRVNNKCNVIIHGNIDDVDTTVCSYEILEINYK